MPPRHSQQDLASLDLDKLVRGTYLVPERSRKRQGSVGHGLKYLGRVLARFLQPKKRGLPLYVVETCFCMGGGGRGVQSGAEEAGVRVRA